MNATTAGLQTVYPTLRYQNAHAAIDWLERVFDARRHVVYDAPDGSVAHAQVEVAGNLFMLGENREDEYPVRSPKTLGGVSAGIYVVLPDAAAVDALHARAAAAGADIMHAPFDTDYGSHDFSLYDLDGHPWTFGTYQPRAESGESGGS